MNVSTNYALKSLWRSSTRTMLSLVGIGIGCAIAMITTSWIAGEDGMMAESTAMSGKGYMQIVPSEWNETRDDRLRIEGDWPALVSKARALPGVTLAAPQAETQCLLGMGTKVQGVGLVGVDPQVEPDIRRSIRTVKAGRYLGEKDDSHIVLGGELAKRLDVILQDELVVTCVSPEGDMNSSLLEVVGITNSGSKSIDSSMAHVPLAKAIELSGRPGINRISLLVAEPDEVDALAKTTETTVHAAKIKGADRTDVLTWTQVNPSLVAARQSDEAFSNAVIFVIVLLVVLGITSAQLTGVLQRGREFSALLAIGMPRRTLWRLIFTEALFLGVFGAVAAFVFAAFPLWYLTEVGVDYSEMVGGSMDLSGILLDPVMRAKPGIWVVPFAIALSLGATLIGAIYPAIYSLRLDPASVLRSRN